jgi:hypothetical protein
MKNLLLFALAAAVLQAQLAPVRVLDTGSKTKSIRAAEGSLYVTSVKGTVKVSKGLVKVLSAAPAWASDVKRDDARFQCLAAIIVANSSARIKACPKDSLTMVFFRTGDPWQVNFSPANAAVKAILNRPAANVTAPAGFRMVRPQVLGAALDGTTAYFIYAARLPGDVMFIGKFTKLSDNYKRVREYSIRVPKSFHITPHLAASGTALWVANEGQQIAEYLLK